MRYQIDVIPDLPPEVQLVDPPANETAVAENGSLPIRVRARTPFRTASGALRARQAATACRFRRYWRKGAPAKPLTGEFQGTYSFQPAKLGLKAGDRVEYSAEAEDNREPRQPLDHRKTLLPRVAPALSPRKTNRKSKTSPTPTRATSRSPTRSRAAERQQTGRGKGRQRQSRPNRPEQRPESRREQRKRRRQERRKGEREA